MATTPAPATPEAHRWRFLRCGGFDQVRIDNAQDLQHLGELDQKLWAVLACATSGLEFDALTLRLLDSDQDGRIRVPELLQAVRWTCQRLRAPDLLFQPGDALPLDALHTDDAEGARLLAAARQVLLSLGQPERTALQPADFADPSRLFVPEHPNGDGVVPLALAASDTEVAALVEHMLAHTSAEPPLDRSGQPGVTQALLDAFVADAQQVLDWHALRPADSADITPAMQAAFEAVQAKVDDHFTRCQLAAFDARATDALNTSDAHYTELARLALSVQSNELAALPLARITPEARLPLAQGVNPAWQAALHTLRDAVLQPLLGHTPEHLSASEWDMLSARLGALRDWQAARAATPVADIAPDTLRQLTNSATVARLSTLIAQDEAADASADAIEALQRLAHYRRDLVRLLRNFVNLSDFYSSDRAAIFQAGTLYIDQRSCELCLRVSDMARHGTLAPLSGMYLLYCQCTRPGEAPITIVAALTGGDADEMLVPGRNGVFYDQQGRDWNASVLKVVVNPVSVRQAFWSPYQRAARLVANQIEKFAADRDKAVDARAADQVGKAASSAQGGDASKPAAPPTPFDIAKFAGIFAAIGLALGALGTAVATLVTGFLGLPVWQMPLVLLGLVLVISGPSMLLAWLKLRQRNLGPLLDANGWAVNIRARINVPFGESLTGLAQLPPGAERALTDPYAEAPTPWRRWVLLGVLLALTALAWQQGWLNHWLP